MAKKFCIVERRKMDAFSGRPRRFENCEDGAPGYCATADASGVPRDGLPLISLEKHRPSVLKSGNDCLSLSVPLTSQEMHSIRNNTMISILNFTTPQPLFVRLQEDAHRLILHFHLDAVSSMNMLRPMDVCRMLLISRSTLSKMIREKTIRSYKVGRMRRFALQDILTYLAGQGDAAYMPASKGGL